MNRAKMTIDMIKESSIHDSLPETSLRFAYLLGAHAATAFDDDKTLHLQICELLQTDISDTGINTGDNCIDCNQPINFNAGAFICTDNGIVCEDCE